MATGLYKKGLVLVIIGLFIGAGAVPSISGNTSNFGNTIYVDDDSECPGDGTEEWPYCKIQYAIVNASDSDTIQVRSGIYYENVFVNKSVTIIGEGKETTIIDGNLLGDVLYVTADWVNISGFTIQNSGNTNNAYSEAGIDIRSNNNTILDNNLGPNNVFGVYVCGSYNIIEENYITSNDDGIHLRNSDNNTITGNTITNNAYDGICITNYTYYTNVSDNLLEYNHQSGIHINIYSSYNIIFNNAIYNSAVSFCILIAEFSVDNDIIKNRLYDGKNGIRLEDASPNYIIENHIEDCSKSIHLRYCNSLEILRNNLMAKDIAGARSNALLFESDYNTWKSNFWNDHPKVFPPKRILGWSKILIIYLPNIFGNVDWSPQKKPYDYE